MEDEPKIVKMAEEKKLVYNAYLVMRQNKDGTKFVTSHPSIRIAEEMTKRIYTDRTVIGKMIIKIEEGRYDW